VKIEDSAAGRAMFDVSHLSYHHLTTRLVPLLSQRKDPLASSREMARLSAIFRANYEQAAKLAREGGAP
jgi:hypothetical protein